MKGCEQMNIKLNKILAAFLIIMLALTTLIGCSGNVGGSADKPKKDYSNIEMNPNISIPGYESLDFKAGKKKQSVNFYNPKENTCYFRITLVLKADDGTGTGKATEDEEANVTETTAGTDEAEEVLWTSELIEPGEEVKTLKLDKELESGDYPAILKYECFSLKDEAPLNGSNVELTLTIR